MNGWVFVAVLTTLAVFTSGQTRKVTTIDKNSNECGETVKIDKMSEYQLVTTGETPDVNCKFTFDGEMVDNCKGLCYLFDPNAMIKDPNVRVIVESASGTTTYDNTNGPVSRAVCLEDQSLTINLQTDKEYQVHPKTISYRFALEVYNKCAPRGSTKSITFEEALKNLDGYHHGKDREDRERSGYISGILLGFGLASIFLVVLLIGYCYVRNSPNRGPNRSVGMPKVGGFKKNMKPNKEQPSSSEMGVKYTATGEGKPESKPLLTVTAGDPEKPPVDTHVVAVEEGK